MIFNYFVKGAANQHKQTMYSNITLFSINLKKLSQILDFGIITIKYY